MNSMRDVAVGAKIDPTMRSLMEEASANIRARKGEAAAELDALPKQVYEEPIYDGKQCAACKRRFSSSSEYLICKLCDGYVCRARKNDTIANCKALHHAHHHVEFLKAQKESKA